MTTRRIDLHAAAPHVLTAMAGLTKAASAHLDPLLAELVRVRVSQINGCAFCLSLHTRAALDAGESETRLAELASWRESPLFTAPERAALTLAEAMTSLDAGVADEVFAAAREHFAETPLTHLLWTIAAINAWNRVGIAAFPPDLGGTPGRLAWPSAMIGRDQRESDRGSVVGDTGIEPVASTVSR